MNTVRAMAMGALNRGQEQRVFDWDRAARILRGRGMPDALAGLQGDLEWTGGCIMEDGGPVSDEYTYLASTWAVPVLVIDEEEIPCYVMASETKWSSATKWPASALAILNGEG